MMLSAYYSLMSLVMFLHVALADYLRRADIQFVLFQLTRSISSNLAASGISIFKATALTQFNKGLSGVSTYNDADGDVATNSEAQGDKELQTVIEAAWPDDEEDSEADGTPSSQPHMSDDMLWEEQLGGGSMSSARERSSVPPISANLIANAPGNSATAPLKATPSEAQHASGNAPAKINQTLSWEALVVTTPAPAAGSVVGSTLAQTRAGTGDSFGSSLNAMLVGASSVTSANPVAESCASCAAPIPSLHSHAGPAAAHDTDGSFLSPGGNPEGTFVPEDMSITETHTPVSASLRSAEGLSQAGPSHSQIGICSQSGEDDCKMVAAGAQPTNLAGRVAERKQLPWPARSGTPLSRTRPSSHESQTRE